MKNLLFGLSILSLFVSNCLAMELAVVNPGHLTHANLTTSFGNRSQFEAPSGGILRDRISQEWKAQKPMMGKNIKSLMNLYELLIDDLNSYEGGYSLAALPGGYRIDVVTFAALSDTDVRAFIDTMGIDLKQQKAEKLEQLGNVLSDIFTLKQERENRQSFFHAVTSFSANIWHSVCGETCTPDLIRNFLYKKKQTEKAESDELVNLVNDLSDLTELSQEECCERIEMMLNDRVPYFKNIKSLCESAKSHKYSLSVESGEQTQSISEDCDDVLIKPDMPRVIKKIFYMLAHQLEESSHDPDLSVLLKTSLSPRFLLLTEQIVPCGKYTLSEAYTPEQAVAVEYLMTLLKKNFCKQKPMTLRFFIDPKEKTINVVDAIPLTKTTIDDQALTYLKEKSVRQHFCLNKEFIELSDERRLVLGKYFLSKGDCPKGIKYLEQVAEKADDNDKRIAALSILASIFQSGGNCGEKDDEKYDEAIKLLDLVATNSDVSKHEIYNEHKIFIWNQLAEAYKMKGNQQKASQYYALVAHAKIDRTDESYESLKTAQALLAMDEELKGINNQQDFLNAVIKKAQSPNPAIKVNAFFLLGQIYYEGNYDGEKDFNKAEKYFSQALKIVNSNPKWLANSNSVWIAFAKSIRGYLDKIRNARKS